MAMTFQLKDFDGPLDLLLHLVNKAQIDIREIFVSQITDQYIDYVRSAVDLDMEDASDFLVMAATLLEIKSRSMLPKPPAPEDGVDQEEELIRRLEEYKRFKETAIAMRGFENTARALFSKLPEEFPLPPPVTELTGLTLEALTVALQRVLARKPDMDPLENNRYGPRDIHRDEHTVQECMLTLLKGLRRNRRLGFTQAMSAAPTREEVVTLFLALLELLRLGKAHVEQDDTYQEIWLLPGRTPGTAEEDHHGDDTQRRADG